MSTSPYSAPLVWVRKVEGTWRMCMDYRKLNQHTINDKYPIPNITAVLETLAGCTVYSSMDCYSGYHQMMVAEEDMPKTAFSTLKGHYQFKRMPFGLKNAPA